MNLPPSGAPSLRLYSTAARAVVPVELDADRAVRIYTCGPTVYRSVHLGNLRSYLLADSIRRLLLASGYEVRHVKNITDVGHMRQELLDRGEDKVVAEALRAGITSLEIARRFTDEFLDDERRIRILPAHVFPRATDHVGRMIAIAEALVATGFAYERHGNVYFRVGRFAGYGELGGSIAREGLRQGVRSEADPLKDDPRDFALWKAAEPERTELVWPSPWGRGFPGWHIECTAMSTEHLGPQVDIHTGGVDNIFPHHEDERAQSEAFTGVRPFARIWVHGQHLLADGVKMAKSTGNAYTLGDLEALEFEPLAFRYLCLTAHYRSRLNFTFTSLRAAQTGLRRLRAHVAHWGTPSPIADLGTEARACREQFWALASDDLGLPRCLALVWSLARGSARMMPPDQKAALAHDFDRLLGLDLGEPPGRRPADPFRGAVSSPRAIVLAGAATADASQASRATSDAGQAHSMTTPADAGAAGRVMSGAGRAGPDGHAKPTRGQASPDGEHVPELSLVVVVQPDEDLAAVERCLRSLLQFHGQVDTEVVLVDATGSPHKHSALVELTRALQSSAVRLVWIDHDPGAAGARNLGLRAARGTFVGLLDPSVELTGDDALAPLLAALRDPAVGAVGPFGLLTPDLRHFHELDAEPDPGQSREVDALQNYLLVFRRAHLERIGPLDEHYRFYRILDLDLSYTIRDRVGHLVSLGHLPLVRHRHALWEALGDGDREERSRKNFGRFLKRWDHRHDLARHGDPGHVEGPVALHG